MSYRKMVDWNRSVVPVPVGDPDTLWSCGINNYGQLGLGDAGRFDELTQVGSDTWQQVAGGGIHTLAIKSDGTLWSCGRNRYGQLGLGDTDDRLVLTPVGSNTWQQVSGGGGHTLIIHQ